MIMENFQKLKLRDLISVLTDYHANGSYEKLKQNVKLFDIPNYAVMIRTTNFEKNDFDDLKYIDEHAYNFLKKSKVYPSDLLMNKIANAGSIYLMPDIKKPVSLAMNLFLIRINPELADQKYIYYYLKANESYVKSFTNGATTNTITKELVRNLDILAPGILYQHKISSILYTYDNLIENNEKRIKALEEMTQLLYTEWFVKFKFPGYEKVKMVDSGTECGIIPQYFYIDNVANLVEFVRGVEPGSANYKSTPKPGLIPFLRVGDLGSRNSEIFIESSDADGKIIERKDIALTMDGTVGRVVMGVYGAYSTGIRKLVIKNQKINREFLFCYVLSDYIQNIIKSYAKGSTILHASESIKYMKVVLPTKELMDEFARFTKSTIDQILNLQDSNRTLSQIRDLLIPQLVTGKKELKFKEIKKPGPVKNTTIAVSPYQDAVIFALITRDLAKKYSQQPSRFEVQKNKYFIDRYLNYDVRSKYAAMTFGPYDKSSRYRGGESVAIKSRYISLVNDTKFEVGKNISVAEKYYSKSLSQTESIFAFVRSKSDNELELLATIDYAIFDIVSSSQKRVTAKDVFNYIDIHPIWHAKIERLNLTEEKIEQVMSVLKELAKLGINYPKV